MGDAARENAVRHCGCEQRQLRAAVKHLKAEVQRKVAPETVIRSCSVVAKRHEVGAGPGPRRVQHLVAAPQTAGDGAQGGGAVVVVVVVGGQDDAQVRVDVEGAGPGRHVEI